MKTQTTLIDFIIKEWLVIVSGIGLILTSLYTKHFPAYSVEELKVLFILFILFVSVKGLYQSGLILKIAKKIERGRVVPLKLIITTFILSMLVTNDISLIIMVPLTLSFDIKRKDILVILEALAANAGSAFTPFGNPQNLFIYWFYGIHPVSFIRTIAPFSLILIGLLVVSALFLDTDRQKNTKGHLEDQVQKIDKKAYAYGAFLLIDILVILRILPIPVGSLVILFALIFDRKALLVDYTLLLSFLFFFGIAGNLELIIATKINHAGHIFLFSALSSQVISNVPATLLFAKFTPNWEALLWGVNAGGFGSLFGSLANLIAYKIYLTHENTNETVGFTLKFTLIGYVALFVSVVLYFILYTPSFPG